MKPISLDDPEMVQAIHAALAEQLAQPEGSAPKFMERQVDLPLPLDESAKSESKDQPTGESTTPPPVQGD